MSTPTLQLSDWNELAVPAAAATVRPLCPSEVWIQALLEDRPYRCTAQLRARSASVLGQLPWPAVSGIVASHARIGQPPAQSGTEARLSRQEQAGLAGTSETVRDALAAGNAAYRQRFGQLFLIRAAGRDAAEILRELNRRLLNDPLREQAEVRAQLIEIVDLRLASTVGN
jgi:2-oxo-4-hydroxy-4-carboxy-5-ureidoimidazoline decarboxylase